MSPAAAVEPAVQRWAAVSVVAASVVWGVYWIPQRELAALGLGGGWATVMQFACGLAFLLPVALWRTARGLPTGAGRATHGLLLGGGFVLYANSLFLTNVVHALLLFYIVPLWGAVLEILVMRRRVRLARWGTIALGLAGVWVIMAGDGVIPWPRNLGDWMALASGVITAVGILRYRLRPPAGLFDAVFPFTLYGTVATVLCVTLLAGHIAAAPVAPDWAALVPVVLLVGVVYMLVANAGILWGASRLEPSRFGVLMMADVAVGVATAAVLAGEPFGWREALGSALILGAAALEAAGVGASPEPRIG